MPGWKRQLEVGGQVARAQVMGSTEEEIRRLRREVEVLRRVRRNTQFPAV